MLRSAVRQQSAWNIRVFDAEKGVVDEPTDVALLLLLVYVAPALTVLVASPDVSFAGRMGVTLIALLLVLSAVRSGERIGGSGRMDLRLSPDCSGILRRIWAAKVYAGRPCAPLCQDR
ncbi:hypothetical protein BH24ACT19_BH24ACT19_18860 [soil metagenome]